MDAYGKALLAYFNGNRSSKIKVESDVAETEYWPLKEFFHSYDEMSAIEQKALSLCRGRVLDVGAGSGSHSLYLQQKGLSVTAIDTSEGAVEVMQKRGVNAILADFYTFNPDEKFDTLLFMMNGAGIAGSMDNLPSFLQKAKAILAEGGQIILDSSDLIYLFLDDDGSALVDLNDKYYGELEYTMSFKGQKDAPFKWLFVDFDNLQCACRQEGLDCQKIMEDEHFQYLASITF